MEPKTEIDTKRQKTIQSILLGLIPMLGILALLRYFQGEASRTQALLDTGLMTIALFSLVLLRQFPRLQPLLTRFVLIVSIGALLFTIYNQQGSPETLIWGITVTLMAFLLTGRHEGWFWSLLAITCILLLIFLFPAYLYRLDTFAILTFIGNALLIAMFASWYEYLSEKEMQRIRTEHSRLESLVRYRTRSLHEANAKAMKALKKAEEASRAKSTFLANVSHEIRTPLNAINGFISLLLKDETDPKKKKQLQTINESADILTQLISDILDLSKIESGNMELHFSAFDPRQLFFSVTELHQSRAMEKQIDFHIEYCHDGEQVSYLYSDPMRLRQVLGNLLSNAIKFTPKGGKIVASACYKNGWLTFTVEDNGIGMTPADQERIFRPFQQVHRPDGNIQGTGLGLAICREITERLHGKLEVRSAPGFGSTFTFSIPAEKVEEAPEEKSATKQRELPEKIDTHLLVVEDVRANQMFITMVLDRYGITYDIANDGVEAVEMYQKNSYDLILMDENMPRMNGIEATQKIRAFEEKHKKKPTPIIALTANAVSGDRERLLASGMNEYISKPVNPDVLIRTIVLLLDDEIETLH